MQREEQELIENLFSRLKQAESQTAARDAAAEQLIKQHLQAQPGAPYYMAQAILIQEAALKKLNERVQELENHLAQQQAQQQQQPKSSGGFLSSRRVFIQPVWRRQSAGPTGSAIAPVEQRTATAAAAALCQRACAPWQRISGRRTANRRGRSRRCGHGRYADQHVPPLAAGRDR